MSKQAPDPGEQIWEILFWPSVIGIAIFVIYENTKAPDDDSVWHIGIGIVGATILSGHKYFGRK